MSVTKKYIFHYSQEFSADIKRWETDHNCQQGKKKIKMLLENMTINPFKGLGKPEPLKHTKGVWSRRILGKHRLTYTVNNDIIHLLTCREHYK
ncbi:MAG: Txe/YoeB family addiction module toxin [Mycoplasmataceae bacterium]|nr:Txe/YoeB family addiction module toxin [Mycoplasmataceae bacterium]